MKHVTIHTAVSGAYSQLETLYSLAMKCDSTYTCVLFPERRGHPDDCIRQVLHALSDHDAVDVVTAYQDVVYFLGAAVERKMLTGVVHLHHPDGSVTVHPFTDEGYLSDDWPFGCLMADVEQHLFDLKALK